jgi:hypothetical protein
MSKPPKLSLAAIVAAATPPERSPPARSGALRSAEIVPLAPAKTEAGRAEKAEPAPSLLPLKQRARQMSVYLEPPVYDQLRDLAFAERTKMHGLMLEALDLLFKQRGSRSIDQLVKSQSR